MDVDDPKTKATKTSSYVTDLGYNLESYISRYAPGSETLIQRILFLASMCNHDESLSPAISQCYAYAEQQIKANGNTLAYRQVFAPSNLITTTCDSVGAEGDRNKKKSGNKNAEDILHQLYHSHPQINKIYTAAHPFDVQWVNHADHAAQLQEESLQSRLSSAQSHLSKEAIRTALVALSDFYLQRGFLREAQRYLLKSRDVCTSHVQTSEMCFKMIQLSLDLADYTQASSFVRKAAHSVQHLSSNSNVNHQLAKAKVHAASALCLLLHDSNYHEAALKFASVPMDLLYQYNQVIAPEDIALYGTILCLATQDRTTIQRIFGTAQKEDDMMGPSGGDSSGAGANILGSGTNVMGGSSASGNAVGITYTIKQRLELLPWLSDMVQRYMRAEYGPCLSLFQQHLRELELDLRLHPHLSKLHEIIRNKCMVQYLVPYSSVELTKMKNQFEECFPQGNDELETSLMRLIGKGQVKGESSLQDLGARINAHNKKVVLRRAVPCARRQKFETQQRIQLLSERFQRDTEAILMRTSCIERGMLISAEQHAGNLVGVLQPSRASRQRGRTRRHRGYVPGGVGENGDTSEEDDTMQGVHHVSHHPEQQDDVPMEENGQDV